MSKENSWYNQKRNGIKVGHRLLAFMGYWSPLLSLIAGFSSRKRSKFAFFHSIQGGIISLSLIIIGRFVSGSIFAPEASITASFIWLVLWALGWVLLLSCLFLMASAFWGKRFHLPLVGRLSEQLADRWFIGGQGEEE